MLVYNPRRRLSARDALEHPFFAEDPQPATAEAVAAEIENVTTLWSAGVYDWDED